MKVTFQYNKERDMWCLKNKGKASNNDSNPTAVYQSLVARYGEEPTWEDISAFIDAYIAEKNINMEHYLAAYQAEWNAIADQYVQRAESIFGASLQEDVTAYLTINNRCPYNILQNYFFVSVPTRSASRTAMHELWHFYTWYSFGSEEENRLGKKKYNDLKESLTVLLNIECKDLMLEGVVDGGYPQHKEVRARVLDLWRHDRDIKKLWNTVSAE